MSEAGHVHGVSGQPVGSAPTSSPSSDPGQPAPGFDLSAMVEASRSAAVSSVAQQVAPPVQPPAEQRAQVRAVESYTDRAALALLTEQFGAEQARAIWNNPDAQEAHRELSFWATASNHYPDATPEQRIHIAKQRAIAQARVDGLAGATALPSIHQELAALKEEIKTLRSQAPQPLAPETAKAISSMRPHFHALDHASQNALVEKMVDAAIADRDKFGGDSSKALDAIVAGVSRQIAAQAPQPPANGVASGDVLSLTPSHATGGPPSVADRDQQQARKADQLIAQANAQMRSRAGSGWS